MSSIDQSKMVLLEKEFKLVEKGLKLSAFVWLLQTVISFDAEDSFEVINALVQLFRDIDINGDGRLEWSEFNQYIMDEVFAQQDFDYLIEEGKTC